MGVGENSVKECFWATDFTDFTDGRLDYSFIPGFLLSSDDLLLRKIRK
jgi:hypothetical protein